MTAFALRQATVDDLDDLLPRTAALNAHEGIEVSRDALRAALAHLLGDASLGGVWLVEDLVNEIVGYAIVTYGYDLEFAGRDAWLTELWIDESARARGAGAEALAQLPDVLRSAGVHALHLQVRPDNPAHRLYARAGFTTSPRVIMTRRL